MKRAAADNSLRYVLIECMIYISILKINDQLAMQFIVLEDFQKIKKS